MSCSGAKYLLMVVLSISILIPASSVDVERFFRLRYKVHIANGFKSNEKPLFIHCYSKDDDLGEHTLWMKGDFSFKFGVHMLKTTHFWCDMQWGSKKKTVTVFSMDDEFHFCMETGNCFWLIKENGFFISEDNSKWERRYYWPFDHA